MSVRFDVTLRLEPEVRAWIREADGHLNAAARRDLPTGAALPAEVPREVAELLFGEHRWTGLLFTDVPGGLRVRSAVGGASLDAALEILKSAQDRFGSEALQRGNAEALAGLLLRPLLDVASPETLRAAQALLERQAGASVSFVALHAADVWDGSVTTEAVQEALLETRRSLLSAGRTGRPVMAIEAALAVARASARAEIDNRLEGPEEDESPSS